MSVARTVNIGGDPNDTNYRYKMPPLQTKIEGRGNGIKTVLLNVVDVSKDLRTLPEYATKFFGVELGALSKFDKTRQVGIVNGAHQSRDLQVHLRKFVNEFILCPQCRLPELEMRVKKSNCVVRCASCGQTGVLPTGHRLKQYIVNNPPTKDRVPPPRRRERGQKAPRSRDNTANEAPERPRRNARKSRKVPNSEDQSWSSFPELEALASKRHSIMLQVAQSRKGAGRRARRDDDDGGTGSELQFLRAYMKIHSVEEICYEIERIQQAHDFDATKRMKLIFDAIFDLDESAIHLFIPTIEENAALLERFTRTKKEYELFVGCVEEILTIRQPRLANRVTVSKIFSTLYQCGILDEWQLVGWYESPADSSYIVTKEDAQQVRELVTPFIEWLRDAPVEEGEEDDDDEVDHVEDVYEEDVHEAAPDVLSEDLGSALDDL